ncbi:MAG: CoB--CoM heterodisulfide reductase iron-sulfur subunit A family protein [Bacteroidales bacterium]|nr:CoB--CoM heterodisulfide reductase iron-sulfur subunit A family protein [Bacteroidales bacterium]
MEEPRIGVYVCWCGTNISKTVDVEQVTAAVSKLPHVIIARNYKYMCSDPGQDLILKDIREHQLNRVVVSACSPRIHELTFRKVLVNAGLNPYLFEMANIREQVSWVHDDRDIATGKATSLVKAAIQRVAHHEPLEKRRVDIHPATLIIGGGITGLTAAMEIADSGNQVHLIEKSGRLGGMVSLLHQTHPHLTAGNELIQPLIDKAQPHPKVRVWLNSQIEEVTGYVGNFRARIRSGEEVEELDCGNIIVATGTKPFDPSQIPEYGYGMLPGVITSLEFEEMLRKGKIVTKDGESPCDIAIIHCVGSRNMEYHPYCSRVCCTTALKFANQIRAALPDAGIYQLYADMRSFGKGCEEFYMRTSRRGVIFMMFDQKGKLPVVKPNNTGGRGRLLISTRELLSGEEIEIPADLVILMVASEAREDARETAHLTGISLCGNQFFIEKHPKLDPVATTTDGVFIAGSCQGPKDIADSVSQARAAAARVLASILCGSVEVEVTTAVVNDKVCCGCQTCISVCPYHAIHFDEEKRVSEVNEILCKGCGTCGSACPTGAIHARHFTDDQILSQIEGLLSPITLKAMEMAMED